LRATTPAPLLSRSKQAPRASGSVLARPASIKGLQAPAAFCGEESLLAGHVDSTPPDPYPPSPAATAIPGSRVDPFREEVRG